VDYGNKDYVVCVENWV